MTHIKHTAPDTHDAGQGKAPWKMLVDIENLLYKSSMLVKTNIPLNQHSKAN